MKNTLLLILLAATPGSLGASGERVANYTAHEWGTFTSVQGADGVAVEWNPLETSELPRFVHDWNRAGLNRLPSGPLGAGVKTRFSARQRMETPVIYFYSDTEQTVDVTVRFPEGLITEWFPAASDIGPSVFPPNRLGAALDGVMQQAGIPSRTSFATMFTAQGTRDSRIAWKQLRILPPGRDDDALGRLPRDTAGGHYFAARETDAAILQMNAPGRLAGNPEHEKFLFYRGIANFQTPLRVTLDGDGESRVTLGNTGDLELHHLLVLEVRHGRGAFTHTERIAPGERVSLELPGEADRQPLSALVSRVGDELSHALVAAGLYEREARAMVKTWRESWLEEEGVRVLYLLPRPWTDQVLPLTLNPPPRQLERVMVGRAEIVTPGREWELLRQIVRYSEADPEGRQRAIAEVRQIGLGRFLEPAIRRVLGSRPSPGFSQAAWDLMNAVDGRRRSGDALSARR